MISLYFHIPFCTKKCPYCHFYVIPNRLQFQELLKDGLELEWEMRRGVLEGKEIVSIYFGGGTPSLFEGIGDVLARIKRKSDCEITIEANPEESSLDLFRNFKSLGINRLSLGVQSLDDRSLQDLERIHTAEKAKQAIWDAERAGFKNVSIDLMYDLPGMTMESWRYTLDQLDDLPIQHLSLYNLTIEPYTAFYKRKVKVPDSEQSLQFLNAALQKFEEIGLKRYEVSAFAKEGYESRHNSGYWTGRPFLGFGPSAFSYWDGERFKNVSNIQRYVRSLKENKLAVDFRERLDFPACVKELLAIHLRLKSGVDLNQFEIPIETQQSIENLIQIGLLHQEGNQLRMTDHGFIYYDSIAEELM